MQLMKRVLLAYLIATTALAETKVRNAITQGAPINVMDKNPPCNGTGDDQPAFALAVAALPAAGGTIDARACTTAKFSSSLTLNKPMVLMLGFGTITLGTSQVLVTASNVKIIGTGDSGFGGVGGTTFSYSGTAPAIDVGDGTNPIFHTKISGIQIVTTGSAVSSATAMGIRCRNCRYTLIDSPVVAGTGTGFQGGEGIQFAATASSFDATNEIQYPRIFDCFYGIHLVGVSAPSGANDLKVYGGFVIGHTPVLANSFGIFGDAFSDSLKVYGTDVESYADNYHFSGTSSANHTLLAARSEFPTNNHFYVGAGVARVQGYGFTPESPGYSRSASCAAGATNCFTDLGTGTQILDAYHLKGRGLSIWPSANATETLSATKADGTTVVFDLSTNGTPRLELPNGVNFTVYSDAFVTPRFQIQGSNGAFIPGTSNFAGLGTPANFTVMGCTDCTIANPCAGGGTGALAKRLNGAWVCN